MRTHVDKDEPSYQAQAVTTCFAPAGNGTEAMAEEREDVDVREVVVFYEGREEWSEVVGRLVCMLSTATSPGCVFGVQGGRGVRARRLRGYKGEWCT